MDPIDFLMENGTRGGKAICNLTVLRELGPEDAGDVLDPEPTEVPTVVKLRQRHHNIARLIAEGRKPGEVAAIMGMAPGRVSTLQRDPAFKELVAYYASQVDAQYLSVHERLAQLSDAAVAELQDRLEAKPEAFSHRELKELAEMSLDRTGHAPKAGTPTGGPAQLPPALNITFVSPAPAHVTIEGHPVE